MGIFRKPLFMTRSVRTSGVVGNESVTPASVNAQSFDQRQYVDRNRNIVGGYSEAKLGTRGHIARPTGIERPHTPIRESKNSKPAVSAQNIDGVLPRGGAPKKAFQEPALRHYNPYG